MIDPIHNHHLEVDTLSRSSSAPKKTDSHQPPLYQDRLEMHDGGICSWIGTAFWYVIDCLNVVYDYVMMLGWNLLAKIGWVNPPEAQVNPFQRTFAQRAFDVKAVFSEMKPFEQIKTLRKISCDWNDDPNERQRFLDELKDLLGDGLRDALIAHAGEGVDLNNLAERLSQMDATAFNRFLEGFAQFQVETLALGYYLDDAIQGRDKPPTQEAHFRGMELFAAAHPHPEFERDIDAQWMKTQFAIAKDKLTASDKDVLLSAYNVHRKDNFHQAINTFITSNPGSTRMLLSRLPGFDSGKREDNDYLLAFYLDLDEVTKVKFQGDFYQQNRTCKEQWEVGFNNWFRDVTWDDEALLLRLQIARFQIPSVVKRTCEEMLADNLENRESLFNHNPAWVQKFLDALINPQVNAQYEAHKDAQLPERIQQGLELAWVAKQGEIGFDLSQIQEEPFKQSLLSQVTQIEEQKYRQELKQRYLDAGWYVGSPNLLQLIDDYTDQEGIKAAVRTSMPR